jgi:NADPH:quinone reductase-like Zn-dependent oxidoreductase
MPTPGVNQIVIRNHAVAINPIDDLQQRFAIYPTSYPSILGHDVAGVVISIGTNVSRFNDGDRVLGHATGVATGISAENAFQKYTLLRENMASQLPHSLSFEKPLLCFWVARPLRVRCFRMIF